LGKIALSKDALQTVTLMEIVISLQENVNVSKDLKEIYAIIENARTIAQDMENVLI
jgi:hypothetical protein